MVDAEAWQLLRNALRDSQAVTTKHLGIALAGEVGARLGDMTLGLNDSVELTPDLKIEGLHIAGEFEVSFDIGSSPSSWPCALNTWTRALDRAIPPNACARDFEMNVARYVNQLSVSGIRAPDDCTIDPRQEFGHVSKHDAWLRACGASIVNTANVGAGARSLVVDLDSDVCLH